jgi:DNA-binding NarL/FixJ family response regulator
MSVPYKMTTARALQIARMTQKLHEESELRMRTIVALMCHGLCDKLISRRTGISVSSIKSKRSLFMSHHKIKSRTQLGVWAERSGWSAMPTNCHARADAVAREATEAQL